MVVEEYRCDCEDDVHFGFHPRRHKFRTRLEGKPFHKGTGGKRRKYCTQCVLEAHRLER